MCEQEMLTGWAKAKTSRRVFGAGALAGVAAACTPATGGAGSTARGAAASVTMRKVSFAAPGGTMDGEFFAPAEGRHPAVLFWPDIAGIRAAKRQMATRLAEAGFAVLLANPYYRSVAGEQFADFAAFMAQNGFAKTDPWRKAFSADSIAGDARACAAWLAEQREVDAARGMGTQGYCMTGSFAVVGAGAVPGMRAGASFHGGGLVTDAPASPHRSMRAGVSYLIAIAQNDAAKAPGEEAALRTAASTAGAKAEIEVYPADHGWCVPDSPSYDEMQAERAWARLLATYRAAL